MKNSVIELTPKLRVEITTHGNHELLEFVPGGDTVGVGRFKDSLTKDRWERRGHFANLEQCVRNAVRLGAADEGESQSLGEYVERMEAVNKDIAENFSKEKITEMLSGSGEEDDGQVESAAA